MSDRRSLFARLIVIAACAFNVGALATSPPPPPPPPNDDAPARELLVPMEDLNVLLEGPTRRVLLPRAEYLDLVARAERDPTVRAPRSALITAAAYEGAIGAERAELVDLELLAGDTPVVELPLLDVDIHDIPGLINLSKRLV